MLPDNTIGHKVISIHAPREGCDHLLQGGSITSIISIHAPREGCDLLYPNFHKQHD